MENNPTPQVVCPKCSCNDEPHYDKIEVSFGSRFGADVHIKHCPKCGYIYDNGTFVE